MNQGDEEEVLEAGHIFIQTLLLFATVICKCKLSRVQLQVQGCANVVVQLIECVVSVGNIPLYYV